MIDRLRGEIPDELKEGKRHVVWSWTWNGRITATVGVRGEMNEVLSVERGDTSDRCFGVALDIGTTTVVTPDTQTDDEVVARLDVDPESDTLVEGDEDLTLTLAHSSGAATLGAQDTHTLTIVFAGAGGGAADADIVVLLIEAHRGIRV